MKLPRWISKASFLGALSLMATSALAVTRYTYTEIGPPDTIQEQGAAISRSGVLMGLAQRNNDGEATFLWQDGGYTFLPIDSLAAIGTGINASNTICGYTFPAWPWFPLNAFVYGPDGTLTQLPPLENATGALARAINDNGVIVGECGSSYYEMFIQDPVATIWTNGVPSPVPGLPGFAKAYAINSAGMIGGATTILGGVPGQPFLCVNGIATILPLPVGFDTGAIFSLNEQGDAVGYVNHAYGNINHAMLWKNGSPIDLTGLDASTGETEALSINNHQQIVGRTDISFYLGAGETGQGGFIWEKGTMRDLTPLVDGLNGLLILEGEAIDDDGNILATSALSWGSAGIIRHACILRPIISVAQFTVSPWVVTAGASATATVTLNLPAKQGGALVSLTSANPSVASMPATVTIPAGAISTTFTVTTHAVPADIGVNLTASLGGQTASTAIHVQTTKPTLGGFVLNPTATFDGGTITGTVSLRIPAPSGGVRVTLTNTTPSTATIPTSITIPQGAVSKSFTTTGNAPLLPATTIATATLSGVSIHQTLTVSPIVFQSMNLTTSSLLGGATTNGVVRIPVPAPKAGYVINLLSSNTLVATVPKTVTITAGQTSASFLVTSKPVAGTSFVTISASRGSTTYSSQLQVLPPEVTAFSVSPVTVKGGHGVTGAVTLSGKAPVGGMTVNILANPSLAAPSSKVVVAAGSNHVSFSIKTSIVTGTTIVTLTGFTINVRKTCKLTLTP